VVLSRPRESAVAHWELCLGSRVGEVEATARPGSAYGLANDGKELGGEGVEVDLVA
jgi:hypothetical protein